MDVFVARQPIFNRLRQVYGYELLFRSGRVNAFDASNPDEASLQVIDNSYFTFDLAELTGHKRAFINFTRDTLVREFALLLPRDSLVIEVLETVEPDDEVVQKCRRLRDSGYVIALDDFVPEDPPSPLVPLADIIKLDLVALDWDAIRRAIASLSHHGLKFLAEKVETEEQFLESERLGCSYFQGYFFSRPVIVSRKVIPRIKSTYIKLLNAINKDDTDFDAITPFDSRRRLALVQALAVHQLGL